MNKFVSLCTASLRLAASPTRRSAVRKISNRFIHNHLMNMEQLNYESYCGLYCGACDILTAYKRGEEQHQPPEWNELPEPIRRHIPAAPIRCHGCKTDTVFQGCAKCPIRKCAKQKSGIESCLDCKKYPCLLHTIAKIVIAVQRLEKKLPHLKCKPGNLAVIREKGMRAWLEEQQQAWECPDCHASFSWYQTECSQCGTPLNNSNATP